MKTIYIALENLPFENENNLFSAKFWKTELKTKLSNMSCMSFFPFSATRETSQLSSIFQHFLSKPNQ